MRAAHDARPDGSTLDPGARCSHGHHHADQAHQGDRADAPDDGHLRRPPTGAALGKAARADVPRTSHAAWMAGPDRDPMGILCAQDATRVPELVPIRWGRMLVSPFTFYRGAAALMAADLATTPASGLRVQACGDAHISNFGVFAAPDRSLVFDLNDFDETAPGPVGVGRQAHGGEHRDRRPRPGREARARRKAVAAPCGATARPCARSPG